MATGEENSSISVNNGIISLDTIKKKSVEELQVYIDRIPNHVLELIFDQLLVTDLASCCYVAKAWQRFIRDSYTIKLKAPLTFFIWSWCRDMVCMELDLDSDSKNRTMKILNQYKIPNLDNFRLLNSCNSLLSLRSLSPDSTVDLFILNPMTGQFLHLPKPPSKIIKTRSLYGFGFCGLTRKYKMIRIIRLSKLRTVAEICVLDINSHNMFWRNIGAVPYHANCFSYINACVYLNGAIHWVASDIQNHQILICCFDVEDEKFRPIYLPIMIPDDHDASNTDLYIYSFFEIGVFGGDLYFLYGNGDHTIQIWMMKEYGVNGLWIKHHVIRHQRYARPHSLLCSTKACENGLILMICDKVLSLYNPVTTRFTYQRLNSDELGVITSHSTLQTLSFASLRELLTGSF